MVDKHHGKEKDPNFDPFSFFQASTPDIHLTSNGRGPMSGMGGGGLGMNGSSKSLAAGSTHPMLMRSTAGGRGPGDYGPGPPPSTRYAQ